ncbi:MAG: zf-HC2 domain-containing protein [Thermoanaerobaculia bacterium]|nr:zf-HC2 domain-containing protein [Thermoanaerobaculia bacterium]
MSENDIRNEERIRSEERARNLMMAALDDEISAEDRVELERHLADSKALDAEWVRLRQLKEVTRMSRIDTLPEERWTTYWRSIYNRLERGLGWILVSIGAIVLGGWGLWHAAQGLFDDPTLPLTIKIAIFALGFGSVILAVSVGREKLSAWRHDPYKEIER